MTKDEQIKEIATAIKHIEIGDDYCLGDVFREYIIEEIANILWHTGYVKNESDKIKFLEQQIEQKDEELKYEWCRYREKENEARMFREQHQKLTFALAQMKEERDNAVKFAQSVGKEFLRQQKENVNEELN